MIILQKAMENLCHLKPNLGLALLGINKQMLFG